MIKCKTYIVLILLFLANLSNGLTSDSLKAKEKTLYLPNKNHGITSIAIQPKYEITKHDILKINYVSFLDIIKTKTPAFINTLGTYALPEGFIMNGSKLNSTTYSFNSRSISESDYSQFNSAQFPIEFFEKAEIYNGAESVVLFGSETSVNFQEIIYNTAKPYTRIRYAQGGLDFLTVDGVFSQNIAPNVNFNFGFRNMYSLGEDTYNQKLKSWVVRCALRFNLDTMESISIANIYSNLSQGLNGGIAERKTQIIGGERYFFPEYSSLNERNFRNDLSVTYSMRTLDSSRYITSSLFLTTNSRYRENNEFIFNPIDSNYKYQYSSLQTGCTFRYEENLGFLKFLAGSEISYINQPLTRYTSEYQSINFSGYSGGKFDFKFMKFFSGIRYKYAFSNSGLDFGSSFSLPLSKYLIFIGNASFNTILPYPSQNLNLQLEQNILFSGEFDYLIGNSKITTELFYKSYINPINCQPLFSENRDNILDLTYKSYENFSMAGATLNFNSSIGKNINYTIIAGSFINPNDSVFNDIYPNFWGRFDISYSHYLTRSSLSAGIKSEFISSFKGFSFNPLRRDYYLNNYKSDAFSGDFSVYASLKMRNIFLNIEFMNILNISPQNGKAPRYYYIAGYPILGRNLRISLSAPF